jgi:hypothetical protein
MNFNLKATTCTSLLILAVVAATVLSVNIKTCHGLTLYQILTGAIANLYIGDCIYKFYKWIAK